MANARRTGRDTREPAGGGVRVVLTRETGSGGRFAARLEEAGFRPVLVPLTRTLPPENPAPLRRAAREAGRFDWIVFASARGVEAFAAARRASRLTPFVGLRPRVAAVGRVTAKAVEAAGGSVAFLPGDSRASGLAAEWPEDPRGRRILAPRAWRGRPELVDSLRGRGARVREVVAYRTCPVAVPPSVLERIRGGEYAVVVFQAPSAVAALAAASRQARVPIAGMFAAVAIGPTTAAALASLAPREVVVAESPSEDALLEAVARAVALVRR